MMKTQIDEKLLIFRSGHWHYQRRVPVKYRHIDTRRLVRKSLGTTSLEVARLRRDAMMEADDAYWRVLALEASDNGGVSHTTKIVEEERYRAATARALVYGFIYKPVHQIAQEESPERILERLDALKGQSRNQSLPNKIEIDALLGGTPKPTRTQKKVSAAFKLYLDEIGFDEQYNKSPKQKYYWEKTKRTSINYFIKIMGDLHMEDITRDQAVTYRNWWMKRMLPSEAQGKTIAPAKPNTANRHIGNMRNLYKAYFLHIGEEDRPNPFRNMFFKGETRSSIEPFDNKWVRQEILVPGLFDDLCVELKVIIYILIETGARMSEICNLLPEDIMLGHDVPHVSIKPRQNRELKTPDSERDIPLVGCALAAMKLCPNGFERYRDKGELVSANLMKAFRIRKLLPTPNHVIYSLRHSFEKRMLEAHIDYGLRCTFMGHKNNRPAYGEGGSMEYRRDELLKIAHPFARNLF